MSRYLKSFSQLKAEKAENRAANSAFKFEKEDLGWFIASISCLSGIIGANLFSLLI